MLRKRKRPSTNKHWVTDPQKCEEMGRRNGWELIDVKVREPNEVLSTECIFAGEQTSFEDTRYG